MPRRAAPACALCVVTMLSACAAPRPRPAGDAPRVVAARAVTPPPTQIVTRAIESAPSDTLARASVRVLALRGPGPLVIPADAAWLAPAPTSAASPTPPAAPVAVLLDDGTRLHARLFAVRAWFEPPTITDTSADTSADTSTSTDANALADTSAGSAIAARMRTWLPPRAAFASREVFSWPPPADAFSAGALPAAALAASEVPVLLVEPPPAILAPRALWINLTRLDLALITPPSLSPSQAPAGLSPATPPQVWQEGPAWLQELLTRERSHPLLSWRAALLAGELSTPSTTPAPATPPTLDQRDVLESWHAQTQGLWAAALARLHAADAHAAQRLRHRLTLLLRVDALTIPAFTPTLEGERELLAALLNPSATPRALAQAADLWLREQPVGAAWIEDDAAYAGSAGQRVTRVRLANLSPDEAVAYALPGASDSAPDLLRVEPASTALAPIASDTAGARDPDAPAPDTTLLTRVADWSATLSLLPALPLRPPALIAEEFAPDLTLGEWLTGSSQRPAPANLRARIYRAARADDRATQSESDLRWEVLITYDSPARGLLELSLSDSRTASPAALHIDPFAVTARIVRSGREDSHTPSDTGGVPHDAPTDQPVTMHAAHDDAGWRVRVELPDWAVAPSGELVLGIAWVDESGARACWPRAATPWASTCSRALLDAGAWDR